MYFYVYFILALFLYSQFCYNLGLSNFMCFLSLLLVISYFFLAFFFIISVLVFNLIFNIYFILILFQLYFNKEIKKRFSFR